MLSLSLIGSNIDKVDNEIFLFKTKDYEVIEKKAKISIDEAINLVCKSSYYEPFLQHYLIYNNKYVFTSLPPTHAGTLNLSQGLTVDISTGIVDLIQEDTFSKKNVQVGQSIAVKCKQE